MAPRGMGEAGRRSITSQTPEASNIFENVFQGFQNLFLDPTGQGLAPATQVGEGLAISDIRTLARLGEFDLNAQRQVHEAAFANDPILSRQREAAQGLLDVARGDIAGVQGGADLPADLRRTFEQEIRGAQSSRGLLEGPSASVEEAVRLAGGREQFRSQRLAQAQNILSGGGFGTAGPTSPLFASGAASRFAPTAQGVTQLLGLGLSGEFQRRIQNSQNVVAALNSIGSNASSILGGIGGFF